MRGDRCPSMRYFQRDTVLHERNLRRRWLDRLLADWAGALFHLIGWLRNRLFFYRSNCGWCVLLTGEGRVVEQRCRFLIL